MVLFDPLTKLFLIPGIFHSTVLILISQILFYLINTHFLWNQVEIFKSLKHLYNVYLAMPQIIIVPDVGRVSAELVDIALKKVTLARRKLH